MRKENVLLQGLVQPLSSVLLQGQTPFFFFICKRCLDICISVIFSVILKSHMVHSMPLFIFALDFCLFLTWRLWVWAKKGQEERQPNSFFTQFTPSPFAWLPIQGKWCGDFPPSNVRRKKIKQCLLFFYGLPSTRLLLLVKKEEENTGENVQVDCTGEKVFPKYLPKEPTKQAFFVATF